jgi:hypothetical protein
MAILVELPAPIRRRKPVTGLLSPRVRARSLVKPIWLVAAAIFRIRVDHIAHC